VAARTQRTWALAESAALSDALSTACFVMTADEVQSFCGAHPAVGAALAEPGGELQIFGTLRPLYLAASQ
jgi:thiamine biosynthesis lipoprotein